jgi:hypothetical protein
MKTIYLRHLEVTKPAQPAGFMEDVLAHAILGTLTDTEMQVTDEDWRKLHKKYALSPSSAQKKDAMLAGPGGLLHRLITKVVGEDIPLGCSCRKRIREMNDKGWVWCLNPANWPTINGWIKESADLMASQAAEQVAKLREQLAVAEARADRLQTTASSIDPAHTLTLLKAAITEYRAKEAKPCPLRQPTDKP